MTQNRWSGLVARQVIMLSSMDNEYDYTSKEQSNLHMHELTEICLCKQKAVLFDQNMNQNALSDGTFAVIPPGYNHLFQIDPAHKDSIASIYVDFNLLDNIIFPESSLKQKHIAAFGKSELICLNAYDNMLLRHLFDEIKRELTDKEPLYHERVTALGVSLAIGLYRLYKAEMSGSIKTVRVNKNSDQIEPAITFMEEHFSENLKIEQFAQMCHVSESHFRRLFIEKTGMTPVDYLNNQRVAEACRLIRQNKYTMEEIASRCGFGNVSTFYRNFKKDMGKSPLKWGQSQV